LPLEAHGASPAGQTITQLNVAYITFADGVGAALAADDRLVTDKPFNPNTVSCLSVFCAAFIGDYLDIDVVPDSGGEKVAVAWNDNRNVDADRTPGTDDDPLTPEECADFRTRPTDPTIQADLNDGSLDQDTFVEIDL
jgi:hypothetical protein